MLLYMPATNSTAAHVDTGDKAVKIGNYQLFAKLGKGGMSTVYLSMVDGFAGFNKLAVLKVMRPELARSKEFVEMFFNEARLAARLTHPNVVHTYGAGEDQGRLYIAMEYLDGVPWSRVRRRLSTSQKLPLSVHVKVLADTLAGLHYAHELRDFDGASLQVVHCDVSPQNVFVTHDGQVKVVDFGVARAVNYSKVQTGSIFLGRPSYCSPEQARGEALDRRADVFSVGVMLWEALSGQRFVTSKDIAETLKRRGRGDEPRIIAVAPDVSPSLAEICNRAMQLAPEDRFATAADFRKQLLSFLSSNSIEVDEGAVADLITKPFGEERQKVHSIIEQRISRPSMTIKAVERLVDSEPQDSSENTLKADLTELVSVTKLKDDKALAEASISAAVRPHKKKYPLWMTAAVAGVGGIVLLALVLILRSWMTPSISVSPVVDTRTGHDGKIAGVNLVSNTTNPSSPANIAAPASGSSDRGTSPSLDTVELTLSATPKSATLYLDGAPLASNPFTKKFPKESKPRFINAVAAGFISQELIVAFDTNRTIQLDLPAVSSASYRPSRRAYYSAPKKHKDEPGSGTTSEANATQQSSSTSPQTQLGVATAADSRVGSGTLQDQSGKSQGALPTAKDKMDFDDTIVPVAASERKIIEEDPY